MLAGKCDVLCRGKTVLTAGLYRDPGAPASPCWTRGHSPAARVSGRDVPSPGRQSSPSPAAAPGFLPEAGGACGAARVGCVRGPGAGGAAAGPSGTAPSELRCGAGRPCLPSLFRIEPPGVSRARLRGAGHPCPGRRWRLSPWALRAP